MYYAELLIGDYEKFRYGFLFESYGKKNDSDKGEGFPLCPSRFYL